MSRPQTELVADYLDDFGSITPAQAYNDLGIMRLADVVFKLKGKGRKFEEPTELIEVKNRRDKVRRVARYRWGAKRPDLVLYGEQQ